MLQAAGVFWCAAALAAAQPSANWVQGVVYERSNEVTRPLRGAFVSLSSSREQILAITRTDASGQYRFVNLPQERLTISASKPGYLTRQAAGRAGARAIVECSRGCRQPGMDFELCLGAVVTGIVLDGMNEPVSRAAVSIRRVAASASSEKPFSGTTDDRGRFRIAGLDAGAHTLTVRRRAPAGQDETLTKDVTIGEGEHIAGLTLTMGEQASFRLAGSVSGIPFGTGHRTWVEIRPMSGSGRVLQASVGADGRFQFDSVTGGRYRADAAAVKLGVVERTDYVLDAIDVQADTDGLILQPVQPATAVGTVEIGTGALPAGATLRFTSRDGFGDRWARARGAGREFELTGLRPGTYRVEAESTEFYVKGIKVSGETESPDRVVLSSGENRLTVIGATDHAQVFGTVLDPKTGQPLPHARLALNGDRGKYSVRADQAGHFLFGKVIPGKYHICAWTNIAPERVDDPLVWGQAGCKPAVIPIDPSGIVEIDVPATP